FRLAGLVVDDRLTRRDEPALVAEQARDSGSDTLRDVVDLLETVADVLHELERRIDGGVLSLGQPLRGNVQVRGRGRTNRRRHALLDRVKSLIKDLLDLVLDDRHTV